MKARFIQEVGTRASLRIYWGDDCPNSGGWGSKGYHNAETPIGTTEKLEAWDAFGRPEDYPPERWPTRCDHCPAVVPEKPDNRQVFAKQFFNTPSGKPEPGDLFWRTGWRCAERGYCVHGWSNCDGRHLVGVTPNGQEWDIDGRASNCNKSEDREHRCWVRHGDPASGPVTVDKAGNTCAAGAGSIIVTGWHGFLHNGEWRSC